MAQYAIWKKRLEDGTYRFQLIKLDEPKATRVKVDCIAYSDEVPEALRQFQSKYSGGRGS